MPRKVIYKTRLPKIKVSTGAPVPDRMDIEQWLDPMNIEKYYLIHIPSLH